MRIPKNRWLLTIAATVSLTVVNSGCMTGSGYKMPGLSWFNGGSNAPDPGSAEGPTPPSISFAPNSSSQETPDSNSQPPNYPQTQFANVGIQPPPSSPASFGTRTNAQSTPTDPSLAGGPGAMPAGGIAAQGVNAQRGFYNSEYPGGTDPAGNVRSSGVALGTPQIAPPQFSQQAVSNFANQASNFTNNSVNQAANSTNQSLSQAADYANQRLNQASNAVAGQFGSVPGQIRGAANQVAETATGIAGGAQNVANAAQQWGGSPAASHTPPWSSSPAANAGTPSIAQAAQMPGYQENQFVVGKNTPAQPAYTANANSFNSGFTPQASTPPLPTPVIPPSTGYTPGTTSRSVAPGPQPGAGIQPAGFNGNTGIGRGGSFSPPPTPTATAPAFQPTSTGFPRY